ncbi:gibberellin 20 oxidase 1-D-like [Gastrolobium bilobum]|uniref:gibberellin 20 oxidase 1-D-like n=1 Tax=Gastrolobium bilobum TaxID=150636 RepID=UPI002AAF9C78|nr:gibberellin 20 oxidase 1-D-like [Gastrolobium bilobum]
MGSSAATVSLCPPSKMLKDENKFQTYDFNLLQKEAHIPEEFIWPSGDLIKTTEEEFDVPLIDLAAIINGDDDEDGIATAAEILRKACEKHGFFQVINHGVDPHLISSAHQEFDSIFKLPLDKKLSTLKNATGYSVAHAGRFSASLPWKETFTFRYKHKNDSDSQVVDYFKSVLGEDLQHTGLVYQKYCEAMKEVFLAIAELLAISLGADRSHFQKFFEDAESIMRCNSYPACNSPSLTFGTGPHCDPTSITILHEDQVGGLEVLVDNKWLAVRPRPDSFVINIGDTFKVLSNGRYQSCLHRVLVNREVERRSLAFFVTPRGDKTVRPPDNLIGKEEPRKYPDFTWSEFFEFTQKHHRSDAATLQDFIKWLGASKPSNFE